MQEGRDSSHYPNVLLRSLKKTKTSKCWLLLNLGSNRTGVCFVLLCTFLRVFFFFFFNVKDKLV